ncbi:hypothetical protein [Lacinutrix sp.]|uniref:hypothetical protein n=1 Tax=Lacinutrix sp. TaxID=1937692 RepID=UPI003454A6CD
MIENSLLLIKVIHAKLVHFVKGLAFEYLKRTFIHPDGNKFVTLNENLGVYAWQSNHHYAHIKRLTEREGWEY